MSTMPRFHSVLAEHAQRFVAYKRALGCRFVTEERTLQLFDRYLATHGITTVADVTPAVVLAFLASRPRTQPRSYNHLRGVLQRFCLWLVRHDTLAVSPVQCAPRRATTHRRPFLFDVSLARRLFAVARQLPDRSRAPQRGLTYAMIFALLYGLGLRVGEVARLRWGDVDLTQQLLVIRQTKFTKNRLVPFGPRMAAHLREYLKAQEQRGVQPDPEQPVFSFDQHRPIHPGTISQTFHQLLPQLGYQLAPGAASPRVHDLRHSFAVGTLQRWYRTGVNPSERLFALSTFLGHVDPTSTAVYLTITPELLEIANQRFADFAPHPQQEDSQC